MVKSHRLPLWRDDQIELKNIESVFSDSHTADREFTARRTIDMRNETKISDDSYFKRRFDEFK